MHVILAQEQVVYIQIRPDVVKLRYFWIGAGSSLAQ